jgi:perosamine synthetase
MNSAKRIPVCHPVFSGNENTYVMECLETSWISSIGRFIPLFEHAVAQFCGTRHAVAASSGTTALHLALMALGVGPGDEVIVPTLTYVAAANAVSYCGARPVFVDAERDTWNIDPTLIEARITARTRGIMVVHLYGHPCEMDPIVKLARRRGLFVLEDAAESLGAEYKGRKAGALGDIAIFSFFGNKVITTGEGGMVVTDCAEWAEKVRILRGQGMDPGRRYWFPIIGYNYRMTNIQAAIGLAQMEQIDARLAERRRVAEWYRTHLSPLADFLTLPVERDGVHHSFWLYNIVLRDSVRLTRDEVMAGLAQAGIDTRPMFYPMHFLPPYAEPAGRYLVAETVALRGINLPTHSLLTEEDVGYIAEHLSALCHS